MRSLRRPAVVAATLLVALVSNLAAQQRLAAPMSEAALRTRLEGYAADSMRGRLTGTDDNVRATRYIAEELRRLGLEPAGDNGTFLQRVPLVRAALDRAATTVVAATAPEYGTTGGAYLADCQPHRDHRLARDPAACRKLWELSEKLVAEKGHAVEQSLVSTHPPPRL